MKELFALEAAAPMLDGSAALNGTALPPMLTVGCCQAKIHSLNSLSHAHGYNTNTKSIHRIVLTPKCIGKGFKSFYREKVLCIKNTV